ncbi:unnamed protein product, partial [marine sediment metagenome]
KLAVDKAWIDPLGNVLAIKEGSDPNGLRIMLDAHVDEVGFMISHISDDGFITIETLGGIDKRLMLGALLQFQTDEGKRIMGVVGASPPHITKPDEREKVPAINEMFVDIGCISYQEVASFPTTLELSPNSAAVHTGITALFAVRIPLIEVYLGVKY